jgi:hypothetical protein
MIKSFNQFIDIVDADTKEMLKLTHQFRLKAFAEESKKLVGTCYEPFVDPNPEDEFDVFSSHKLIFYKPTQQCIAHVRLICPNKGLEKPLPIEIAGKNSFKKWFHTTDIPREYLGEISQVTILPSFRTKLAILGTLKAIFQMCNENSIYFFMMAIEPRINRVFHALGIELHPVSDIFKYYGNKKCYLGFAEEICQQIQAKNPEVWNIISDAGRIDFPKWIAEDECYKQEDLSFNYM